MFKFYNFSEEALIKSLKIEEVRLSHYIQDDLVFIYLDSDSVSNRILLRKLFKKHDSLSVVILSPDEELGKLAWRSNVFYFLHLKDQSIYPNYAFFQSRILQKTEYKPLPKKLKINFKGGVDIIEIDEICYCLADGNYTAIYLSTGKTKTITMQLNLLESKLKILPQFKRIGKSVVVNLNQIDKIKNERISFDEDKNIQLQTSPLYIKRLKKALIWYG